MLSAKTILALNQAIDDNMGVIELNELGLPIRIINQLEMAGIISIKELLCCTDSRLMKIRNMGPSSIKKIKETVLKIRFNGNIKNTFS